MRVDLGEGQWAELKELSDLRRGDQKAVLKATQIELDPANNAAYVSGANDEEQTDALLRRIIVEWSFPIPLPGTPKGQQSLDQLSIAQGRALQEAVKPYLEVINSKTDPGKKGTDPTAG